MEWPWKVGKLDSVKLHVIDRSGVEEKLTWRHFYRHPYILMPEDVSLVKGLKISKGDQSCEEDQAFSY